MSLAFHGRAVSPALHSSFLDSYFFFPTAVVLVDGMKLYLEDCIYSLRNILNKMDFECFFKIKVGVEILVVVSYFLRNSAALGLKGNLHVEQ